MKNKTLALMTVLLLSGCAATNQQHDGLSNINTPGAGAIQPTNATEAGMLIAQSQTSGNPDAMIYAYRQALEFKPFNKADIYLNIARLEQQRNNNSQAEAAYRLAMASDTKRLEFKESLALLLVDMKRHDEADTLLQEVISADRARLNAASADPVELDPADPAELEPTECVTDNQSPWRSYNGLGLLSDIREQGEQARQYYRCALKIQPGLAMLHTNLGFSYYLEGDYSQAERALTRAVNQDPQYRRAWSNLGLMYYRWGHKSEALAALRKNGTQAEALNDLGYIALMEGAHEEAAGLFQRAIDASPRYYPKAVANLNQAKAMTTANKR
ncbi:Flp pilus assembly protein TadD [Oceanisphaera litoralis]|uniref:tetratricopeptide repeat protein n=1 Tax=Oceanisphaera litoralis TaxID=225144 RepID=UPI00195ABE7D|nr:tetratricopeptide repeat protein [Oceanisphaera litoralis]MBM7454236.1 Flp pilus assembly protein TadD [Oceanisphaera litoralis]